MANSNPVGIVTATKGEVFARGADGKMRRLSVGDSIFEGEVIVTANGSSAEIDMMNGPALKVAEQQTVAVDGQVVATTPDATSGGVSPLAPAEAARVIQTAGTATGLDVNALLEEEAAAAGLAGGAGADGGHGFVDLMRIVELVPGAGYDFPINPTGTPPTIQGEVVPPVSTDVAPPTNTIEAVNVESQGDPAVVPEDGFTGIRVTAAVGDPSDALDSVTVQIPTGWVLMDPSTGTQYTGSATFAATGASFDQTFYVWVADNGVAEDSDADVTFSVTSTAHDIANPALVATSAPASAGILVDAVLDDAIDMSFEDEGEGYGGSVYLSEDDVDRVVSLGVNADVINPYGQYDSDPQDANEYGQVALNVNLPAGLVLGTYDGSTFTPLPTSFTGDMAATAAWLESLAVSIPAGYDGSFDGAISVTYTDPATDGESTLSNNSYTSTVDFDIYVAPGRLNPSAGVSVGTGSNVVLEDGSIAVTVTASAGDLTDELTGVTVTIPTGWTATIGANSYTGTFTLAASGQSFSQVLNVTPGGEDTDVDGTISATASARDISNPAVTATSAQATGTVVVDTVLDDAVNVTGNAATGTENAAVQNISLGLTAAQVSPYGQTDAAPADATETGTATITVTLPSGFTLGTLVGSTFTALSGTTFSGTPAQIESWVESLAVQVAAGADTSALSGGLFSGSISVTYNDAPTADGNPNTVNDSYTSSANFSVALTDSRPTNPVNDTLTRDEDDLVKGTDLTKEALSVTDTFSNNASWGADGFGGIVSVNGVTPVSGVITISNAAWNLVVNASTGVYTFTLTNNLLVSGPGENPVPLPTFSVIGKDGDGSTVSFNLIASIVDDVPAGLFPEHVYIEDLATTPDVTEKLNFIAGADGAQSVVFNITAGAVATDQAGHELSMNGQKLYLHYGLNTDGTTDYTVLVASTVSGTAALSTTSPGVGYWIDLNAAADTFTLHSNGVISNGTAVSATDLSSVGGGNVELKAVSNIGGTAQDVVMTTKTGLTVNTNNSQIGIGSGQSFTTTDAIRYDFVNGDVTGNGGNAVYAYNGTHNQTTAFRQTINLTAGASQADITIRAIAADADSVFFGDAAGESTVAITGVRVYSGTIAQVNAGTATDVTSQVTYTINANGTVDIDGLKDGWIFEVTTTNQFSALQIDSQASTGNYKLSYFSYGYVSAGEPVDLAYAVTGTDGDGDTTNAMLDITLYPAQPTWSGTTGDDNYTGTSNADNLLGDGGNDTLFGGGGNDVIVGGIGTDTLKGDAGDDILVGGSGADTMTGGLGADTFVFHLADAGVGSTVVDTIKDFGTGGTDTLLLEDILLSSVTVTATSGANTSVHITDAAGHDQTIVLEGFATADQAAADLVATALQTTGKFSAG